ncbi:hypothetical protein QSV08_07765 [Maribacter sp. BPC-D8]|uniref:hypothetical protein n=1 Tax=Maribacter sp. BPC-D8 TaxID=3053613 RepID=UPI002B4841A2|nr:hypothetical protein [Maribacter sp. BPC-D8]WRI31141.1 hypothetical protein QSV08_07765 [Maribacter sp. BPC-D8]
MIEIEKYQKQLKTKIDMFSGQFMNNSKWTKLFKELSNNSIETKKCLIKSVFDTILREIEIPNADNFNESFSKTGTNDNITFGGPCAFKEIEQIIFPQEWTSDRQMRDQKLEPKIYNQNITNIKSIIDSVGKFEMEINNENLIIYAYR